MPVTIKPESYINTSSLKAIEALIGNTALHKLTTSYGNLYTKLEYQNCFGSIKDRPALFIIKKLIESCAIGPNTTLIESTSGNFGIALAGICRAIGIKFIAVYDENIAVQKENLLRLLCSDVIKITERDETGGFLLNRIKAVNNFLAQNKDAYNPNQYTNENNYLSYYYTLGEEICSSFEKLDFVFVSVSSCGTVIGLSQRLKEKFPRIKIIGVDVEGSMIFSDQTKKRNLSGIGSSMRSGFLDQALIDDVVILPEATIVEGCYEMLQQQNLLVGASAGAAYYAAKKVLSAHPQKNVNALFITPDHGSSYIDSIYSSHWVKDHLL